MYTAITVGILSVYFAGAAVGERIFYRHVVKDCSEADNNHRECHHKSSADAFVASWPFSLPLFLLTRGAKKLLEKRQK